MTRKEEEWEKMMKGERGDHSGEVAKNRQWENEYQHLSTLHYKALHCSTSSSSSTSSSAFRSRKITKQHSFRTLHHHPSSPLARQEEKIEGETKVLPLLLSWLCFAMCLGALHTQLASDRDRSVCANRGVRVRVRVSE